MGTKKKIGLVASSVMVLSLFLACATPTPPDRVAPLPRRILSTEHVYTKNYKLGEKRAAFVGDPIVKVKDHHVEKFLLNRVVASNDFEASANYLTHYGSKGDKFDIMGTTQHDDKKLILISFPTMSDIFYGINEKGKFSGLMFGYRLHKIDRKWPAAVNLVPKHTSFDFDKEERVKTFAGYLNYEIVYTGMSGQTINFQSREFTSEDLGKPAFSKDLWFPKRFRKLRFRNLLIEIHKVTQEEIVYTVLEDGHE